MATHALPLTPARPTPRPSDRRPERPARGGWSWRIGRLFGIDVYVHATFVLLLGWIGTSHLMQGHGAAQAIAGVALVLAVFAVVVMHELGHALVARRFGIGTRDITLLPIGGVARLDRMPEDPRQELLVAVAGPAVNVVLAALLFAFLALLHGPLGVDTLALVGGPLLTKLMWINVGLAVFNMIPAFPMDGGRVLRALLAMRMGFLRATDRAAAIGQVLAVIFGLVGMVYNPMLVFIALFVWMGAREEAQLAHLRGSLQGVAAHQAMITSFRALGPDETVEHALGHALQGFQDDFPVVANGQVVGVATRGEILRAVAAGALSTPVGEIMCRSFATAEANEALTEAMQRLGQTECRTMPVVYRGQLVGLLTPERVGEIFVMRARHAT